MGKAAKPYNDKGTRRVDGLRKKGDSAGETQSATPGAIKAAAADDRGV
eukprot:CAMPEP_0119113668 /NCGR_PEP_ID=MMETSP1180-20130426/44837_1 /TAXON_ID=3052 ORGANISM="Chlamydomonas cf sp, Strain CCMP681" /NCGR_SAMPLE_ID=MMETSP1180 /ASSEMBLY_ACC=CAM_ASM_000741 /LENGTH=47 /DNA_ID= /DNA_START= /DNA_END= /DNA_ORIENTATION=